MVPHPAALGKSDAEGVRLVFGDRPVFVAAVLAATPVKDDVECLVVMVVAGRADVARIDRQDITLIDESLDLGHNRHLAFRVRRYFLLDRFRCSPVTAVTPEPLALRVT